MTMRATFPIAKDRLSMEPWQRLVRDWIAVKGGAEDTRHMGDHNQWAHEVRMRMPLIVADPTAAIFAVDLQDRDVLEIVYSGITPKAHVDYMTRHDILPCQVTFEALIAFRARFGLSYQVTEAVLLLRRVLHLDDKDLFEIITGLDESQIFYALMAKPDLLEGTGPKLAPVMADFLSGWAQFYAPRLLSVFLVCAMDGHVKSLNAMLAAGLRPFEALGRRDTAFGHKNRKALSSYNGLLGQVNFPEGLRKTLALFDPEVPQSNHARAARALLFTEGAAATILAMPPNTRIAGIAPQDWEDLAQRINEFFDE